MLFNKMGKFIVFEGGHGSGKTTLALKLSDYLISQGKKVILTKEPFRQDIRNIIEELSIDRVGLDKNWSILYLLTADRFLHTKYIQRKLKSNDFVISDRYVLSSFVYQQMQNIHLQRIKEANSFCVSPDITFFIDVPYERRKKRSESRDKWDSFFRRRYEEEETLYRKVCEHFSGEHNIIQVDGSKTVANVSKDVVRIISKKFL